MIDETKINIDFGKKSSSSKKMFSTPKKVNKSYVVVGGIVTLFVLMVIYIFNLEDTTKIKDETAQTSTQTQAINQFDMSKIEAAQNNTELAKIEQAQADILKRDEVSNSFKEADLKALEDEKNELKNEVEKLKREIRDLKTQNSINKTGNNGETLKSKNENDTNKISSDDMKTYLSSIKNSIKLRGDNFNFDGRNYYIGDKIKSYQVRDIQKNSIRFCDDWCYTLIF